MENYFVKYCEACSTTEIDYAYEGKIDDEDVMCFYCGKEVRIEFFNDIKDESIILEIIDMELENANHHSMTSLPSDLFYSISKYIPPTHYAKVARDIAIEFYNKI